MPPIIKVVAALVGILALTGASSAATPQEVDEAIHKGTGYLKTLYKDKANPSGPHGIGQIALSGLALLESGVPADDPAIKTITTAIREGAYKESRTYSLALGVLYLDKLGDPADVPLIQLLAVRLLAGQTVNGGWTYGAVIRMTAEEENTLKTKINNVILEAKPEEVAPQPKPKPDGETGFDNPPPRNPKPGKVDPKGNKLHPEVEKYRQTLWANRQLSPVDDNSNTQFGVLGLWVARRHGVPVEAALQLVEERFMATQLDSGSWVYSHNPGSPSMNCVGLIGMATAIGRREERRIKAEAGRGVDSKPGDSKPATPKPMDSKPKSDDPFFNPPPRPDDPKGAKKAADGAKRPLDARDVTIRRGFAALGAVLGGDGDKKPGKKIKLLTNNSEIDFNLGERDLYFLWSLERVGVIYGLEKIGGVDWYAYGVDSVLAAQAKDGSWTGNRFYSTDVNTSFALLFLTKSNVARDLSSKISRDPAGTELRSVPAPGTPAKPDPTAPSPADSEKPAPLPMDDAASQLAAGLISATDAAWSQTLANVRDAKGADNTRALVLAIARIPASRKTEARQALAERLTRMTAATLKGMLTTDEAELRRAAALACAMKEDKTHIPDLIDRLTDADEAVARAAKAGLTSLTGQNLGPEANATPEQRKAAAEAWRTWYAKQPK